MPQEAPNRLYQTLSVAAYPQHSIVGFLMDTYAYSLNVHNVYVQKMLIEICAGIGTYYMHKNALFAPQLVQYNIFIT